jgi:Uncharacterized protein conserved in bacteria
MLQRTMFQLYLTDCDAAIEFYKSAFDANVDEVHRNQEDGAIMHAEMTAFGQCIAFSERKTEGTAANTMQFCFHFGGEDSDREIVQKAYDVLSEGARIDFPLGSCEWSSLVFGLVDKFGVNWCIFAQ